MAKQEFETRLNTIQLRYKKNKAKQEKIDIKELETLHKSLNKRLIEKLKSCRELMLKQDETLVKINSMLEG
ncbi:hypothetical protein BEWA_006640 [Theileria equi strain WA]|uniref:Uncharacterized protein n=1 Tax=Theileria equi strain WA TaxID=1537102 RepID=L0B0A8_THEEQ|nr:hypothetical protein BEWA_006640 [Theileria equi strain WA]AFZ81255.1 hypothetical protein BEWA_006640 [Theileria equi strain WA]|eukprot:XP_004830921.1 hypothetical protein BEWA_006640 [Theileria equi strain WA]